MEKVTDNCSIKMYNKIDSLKVHVLRFKLVFDMKFFYLD